MDFEKVLLHEFFTNETYARRVLPFVKEEYFDKNHHGITFTLIRDFIDKYNTMPTKAAMLLSANDLDVPQKVLDDVKSNIGNIDVKPTQEDAQNSLEWLLDRTEKWCQERALYNGIIESIAIMDGSDSKRGKGAIPQLLSDALAVCFDTHIGHDFIPQVEGRYEYYHTKEKKFPFDITMLNEITDGGVCSKTLNLILAGTNAGKSHFLCHHAAYCLRQNFNVLYITCEMSEDKIAERIDANIMDIDINRLRELPKDIYLKKFQDRTQNIKGRLIIKEYPTAACNVNHLRSLLNELRIKKKFKPDIIFIDYLSIMTSSRVRGDANTYVIGKAIAEEVRGIAIEYDVPIWSAMQFNRTGAQDSDPELTQISESYGVAFTADLSLSLTRSEKMDEMGVMLFKQLKNRYADLSKNRKFLVGVDRAKMRFINTSKKLVANSDNGSSETDETKYNEPIKTESKRPRNKAIKSDKYDSWNM